MSPPSNAFLKARQLNKAETFYPLHAFVCAGCFLVQLEEFESPEQIFSDYLYFSSYSESWLQHAAQYVEQITKKLNLSRDSFVVEIASNDGYLLQNFVKRNIPCLGIEPAKNVAEVATAKGVPTRAVFFGAATARTLVAEGHTADLIIANNVLAHVPDINDFVAGIATVLKPEGVVTFEFPHLYQLLQNNQFDTIYHEHFSYLSLLAVETILGAHGLLVFAVDQLPTHGGSLRVYACRATSKRTAEPSCKEVRDLETTAQLDRLETYATFRAHVERVKRDLLSYLIAARAANKRIAAYGAAAKGNTLLNYCGIREDFIDYIVDKNPHKQGLFTPGTHIPIFAPEKIFETKPDIVVILPWNLKREVEKQLAGIRAWGGRFVVPVPQLEEL
jgi:2-polyprenyl-3-methyl-5-hydroxy-6-metoxy-1,4-benzoquinol methylase